MKHILKIMSMLVAISAIWIGLLVMSVVPHSYALLVSFNVSIGIFERSGLFTCDALPFIVTSLSASNLLGCITWMLWPSNCWSWFDALPYMSSRSFLSAEGTFSYSCLQEMNFKSLFSTICLPFALLNL